MTQSAFPRSVEVLLYLASPLATLVTAPLLARALGPAARGQYGLATAVATFALTISAWGQAETYLAEARDGRTGYANQTRIAAAGGVAIAVLAAFALLVLGLPPLATLITVAWIPLLNQTNLWRAVAVSSGELRSPALYGVANPLLRTLAYVLLAAAAALGLESALFVTQAAALVAATFTIAVAARRIEPPSLPPLDIRRLLRRGSAIITFDMLNALTLRSDIVILQIFSSAREVGIYAAPASLTTAALALSMSFKSRIQAAVVRGPYKGEVLREAAAVAALGSIGATTLWVSAPWFVPVFFGDQFADSLTPMRILGLAVVPLLMLDLVQGVLVVLAARRTLVLVGSSNAILVVGALFALTPRFGAVGAATAITIAYSIAAIIAWVIAARAIRRLSSI